jgi:hypothetical protein
MRFKFAIHVFCILAILCATLSPACAFISGKGGDFIEICSGLRTLQIQTETTNDIPNVTGDECPFCFQYSTMNALDANSFIVGGLSKAPYFNGFITQRAVIQFHTTYQSRAPPVFS